jgi:hypothetical protein
LADLIVSVSTKLESDWEPRTQRLLAHHSERQNTRQQQLQQLLQELDAAAAAMDACVKSLVRNASTAEVAAALEGCPFACFGVYELRALCLQQLASTCSELDVLQTTAAASVRAADLAAACVPGSALHVDAGMQCTILTRRLIPCYQHTISTAYGLHCCTYDVHVCPCRAVGVCCSSSVGRGR